MQNTMKISVFLPVEFQTSDLCPYFSWVGILFLAQKLYTLASMSSRFV